MSSADQITRARTATHIDIHDSSSRKHWADQLQVSDERLRKAVRMVGTRVSSVSAYLAK
ncbi:DUF3606 domain-containing protein [Methylorubrum zatmanii]|uniref:DUF3606 domain-containing protein n=2 Tax=Methylorubrum TaxID=2282523 RepID=A0A921E0A2_9HYPH|nr:DUF3606 domain-containing protein [Methylorubrum zatmanii]MBD8908974.1 DUF3606 domain-containing protein [Methylorubrum zatmanii]HJE22617.1 DUF3606 domain-containing protein [Methylorubrum populi]